MCFVFDPASQSKKQNTRNVYHKQMKDGVEVHASNQNYGLERLMYSLRRLVCPSKVPSLKGPNLIMAKYF